MGSKETAAGSLQALRTFRRTIQERYEVAPTKHYSGLLRDIDRAVARAVQFYAQKKWWQCVAVCDEVLAPRL